MRAPLIRLCMRDPLQKCVVPASCKAIKMLPSTNNKTSALLSMISWQKEEVGRFRILKASQPRQFGFIQSLDPQWLKSSDSKSDKTWQKQKGHLSHPLLCCARTLLQISMDVRCCCHHAWSCRSQHQQFCRHTPNQAPRAPVRRRRRVRSVELYI